MKEKTFPCVDKRVATLDKLIFSFRDDSSENNWPALDCVYKKFLIGSEVCDKLEVHNSGRLEILAQVALSYPTSLQRLTHLKCPVAYSYDEPETAELFDRHFKVKISSLITYNINFLC
jgi:hypothetical protein